MSDTSLIWGGKRQRASSHFEVINPATGAAFAQAPAASLDQLDEAVGAARKAFEIWSRTPLHTRREMLDALAKKVEDSAEELARLITREQGKPLTGFGNLGSRFEVGGAIGWCQATCALELPVETLVDDAASRIELRRKPIGVVGSITPWNWPLMIAAWHVLPALYAGNTVVMKPSEYTPLATLKFAELANEILPAGVLNIVAGAGDLGRAMTAHSDIDKIVFTGSTGTGKSIMGSAASTLKRLTLELGGNDAGIVLPGGNLDAIAAKIFGGAFINAGQTCAALKRLYVHESQYEALSHALAAMAASMTVGDGLDEGTDFGPVQNETQLNIVVDLAKQAEMDGGTFLTGRAERADGQGYFFPLSVVTGLCDGHALVDKEPFGPILPIISYSDVDDAVARANANPNGLGGSVWSDDIELASKVAAHLECGTVWVNGHGGLNPFAPFGGIKQSGFGVEFGVEGLKEYTYAQCVHVCAA